MKTEKKGEWITFNPERVFENYLKDLESKGRKFASMTKEEAIKNFNLKAVLYKFLNCFMMSMRYHVNDEKTIEKYLDKYLVATAQKILDAKEFVYDQLFNATKGTPWFTNGLCKRLKDVQDFLFVFVNACGVNENDRKLKEFLVAGINFIYAIIFSTSEAGPIIGEDFPKYEFKKSKFLIVHPDSLLEWGREVEPFFDLFESGNPYEFLGRRTLKVVESKEQSNFDELINPVSHE